MGWTLAKRISRPRAESAAIARRFAADVVAGHPYDPDVVALITCELVTNAIQHPRHPPDNERPIRLEIALHDGHAHISVTDPNPRPINGRPTRPSDERGRGLILVDALTDGRAITYGTKGKTVTVRLHPYSAST